MTTTAANDLEELALAREQTDRLRRLLAPVPFGEWWTGYVFNKPSGEYEVTLGFGGGTAPFMPPDRWAQVQPAVRVSVVMSVERLSQRGDSHLEVEPLHLLERWFRIVAALALDVDP